MTGFELNQISTQLNQEFTIHLINCEYIFCHEACVENVFLISGLMKIPASSILFFSFQKQSSDKLQLSDTEQSEENSQCLSKHKSSKDVEREKLWEELKAIGYKTLFSDKIITKEDLSNHELITIEHIIPTSKGGLNNLDNKTLEYKDENVRRGNTLPLDYIKTKNKTEQKRYNKNIRELYEKGKITKAKYKNLLQLK